MNWFGIRCVQCQRKLAIPSHHLCSNCYRAIRRFHYCARCGTALSAFALHCGNCLRQPPHWDQLIITGHYSEPLSNLIHRFKFQRQYWLDHALARLMLLAIYDARRHYGLLTRPEVIIPVPLHHLRQWQRGYNQAALIANVLAKKLCIPVDHQFIQRQKSTKTQRGLSAKDRRNNLKNAFQINAKNDRTYHSIALIDDVITTGSTLNEIALLVKKAGVVHIQVWGIAKT